MRSQSLHRWIGVFALGIGAALQSPSAMADLPPLDFPAACMPSLHTNTLLDVPEPSWSGYATLPSTQPGPPNRAVQATVFRIPCGGNKAALQLRLAAWPDPLLDPLVKFPSLSVQQNGTEVFVSALRVSAPNSATLPTPVAGGELYGSPGMYVLVSGDTNVDFTDALTLNIRHPYDATITLSLPLPRFTAQAVSARPINGRYTGNFFDPAKSGEGINIDIGDFVPASTRHYMTFSWQTYDEEGRALWISGNADFQEGDTHVHLPAVYRSGGRFAGRQGADQITNWGSVDIEFSDCNTLKLSYHANSGLPAHIPSGQGQLQWQRLSGVSGYRCN